MGLIQTWTPHRGGDATAPALPVNDVTPGQRESADLELFRSAPPELTLLPPKKQLDRIKEALITWSSVCVWTQVQVTIHTWKKKITMASVFVLEIISIVWVNAEIRRCGGPLSANNQLVLVKEGCLHLSDLRTIKIRNCERKTTEKRHKRLQGNTKTSKMHKNTNYKVTKLQKEKTWNCSKKTNLLRRVKPTTKWRVFNCKHNYRDPEPRHREALRGGSFWTNQCETTRTKVQMLSRA